MLELLRVIICKFPKSILDSNFEIVFLVLDTQEAVVAAAAALSIPATVSSWKFSIASGNLTLHGFSTLSTTLCPLALIY